MTALGTQAEGAPSALSATDPADPTGPTGPTTGPRDETRESSAAEVWPLSRVAAVTTFVCVSIAWCFVVRLLTDGALVSLWLACGLAAFSVGRPGWYRPLLDWSPFIVFFLAYQSTRGLAYTLGLPTIWQLPVSFDAWLGGGAIPGVWLQQHLLPAGGAVGWWELPVALVYVSHYWVVFVVAAVLRRRSRELFRRFIRRVMVVLGVCVCVYVVMPTAPPWAAAACSAEQVADHPSSPPCMLSEPGPHQETLVGPIAPPNPGDPDHLQRLTARGLELVPGTRPLVGRALGVGFDLTNPVAAVPSLHAALALLASAFLWRRVRRRWRPLLALYPLAMAFTLVWTGDHYVFDILAGWVLVALTCQGLGALERAQSARRARAPVGREARTSSGWSSTPGTPG